MGTRRARLLRGAQDSFTEPETPKPDPRCPKCGYTMCQLFDERAVTPLATVAVPNGKYQCYHCTPISA